MTGLRWEPSKAALTWDRPAAGTATVYDLLRGDADQFPVGQGPQESCLATGISTNTAPTPDAPAPGTAFWYLVRARNVCGTGSYGTTSSGIERVSLACAE